MKGIKRGKFTFVFWILLSLLFIFYIIFILFNNEFISKLIYIFISGMLTLGFLVIVISIYVRFKKEKYLLKIKQEKEKNIRDFYRYQKFLDPPDFDINN